MTGLLWAYVATVLLLTLTPGLDTALVLRTSVSQGTKAAFYAALGINIGLLCWGALVAAGLGALLMASAVAFSIIKYAGACYLAWQGFRMLFHPRQHLEVSSSESRKNPGRWFLSGMLNNLLNPKIGVFYISFLPQFIPAGSSVFMYSLLLASIHVLLGIVWCSTLIMLTRPLLGYLQQGRIVKWMDRVTGSVFLVFAGRLALVR